MIKRLSPERMSIVPIALAMVLIGLLIPVLVRKIQIDSKDSVQENHRATALHLAETGLDRGAWKLRESGDVWTDATEGDVITGYNNDVYSDVAGGEYKIAITSGPSSGEVTIISKGRSTESPDIFRTLKAIFSKNNDTEIPALTVESAINWRPNMKVHWGPVQTFTSITASPGYFYPRKYSAGQITGRDTVNDANNGALPGGDWVNYDYVAFYDLGVPPTIDLDSYRDQAKALTGINAMTNATQSPAGSGYFTPTSSQGLTITNTSGPKDYILNCPTCVIFVEGNVKKFPNKTELRVKALIITGNADFNADSLNLTVDIPSTASQEYQHSSLGTYFTDQGWSDGGSTTINNVGMQGFLYVGEDVTNAGGGAILHGAMYVAGDIKVNTFTVYYDETAASEVETGGTGQMSRQSWDEINESW